MVIDTSAIFEPSPENPTAASTATRSSPPRSTHFRRRLLETQIVLFSRSGSHSIPILHELIERAGVVVVPFDEPMAETAFDAFKRYGKGQGHKEQLTSSTALLLRSPRRAICLAVQRQRFRLDGYPTSAPFTSIAPTRPALPVRGRAIGTPRGWLSCCGAPFPRTGGLASGYSAAACLHASNASVPRGIAGFAACIWRISCSTRIQPGLRGRPRGGLACKSSALSGGCDLPAGISRRETLEAHSP